MSKNLTRKGLAFGAVVALGTTLFAGAPAYAASVLFAPTTGTGNTLVAGETFKLTASLSSDLPSANSTQLKFKVANTTGVAATVKLNDKTLFADAATVTAGEITAGAANVVSLDAPVGGTTAASTLAAGTTSAVYGLGSAISASPAAKSTSAATNPTTISISSALDTTASYAVTAFLDANNNGTLDAGELSSVQTVNFVKVANVGSTVSFTKPVLSSAALKATVAFGADVNVAQLTVGKYKVGFGVYTSAGQKTATGTAGAAIASANLTTASVATAGDAFFTATATAVNGPAGASALPVAGGTYAAQLWSSAADGSTFAAIGSGVNQVVAATADADATALIVAPAINNDAVLDSVSNYLVRAGVAATAVKTTIKKTPSGGTPTAVGAGVVVNVTVSGLTLATAVGATAADTITVNGVAVTSANVSTYATTAVTDANGIVTVPVVTSAGTAGDEITVAFAVANAASVANGSAKLTWTTAALTAPVDLIVGSNTPVHTAVKGGSYTASYALRDQFNSLYTGSAYRLVFTAPGAGSATTSQTGYVPFVNGIATVSLTDNSTAAGTNAATYIIEKQTNGLWSQAAAPLNSTVNAPFIVTATAPVAAAVTIVPTTTSAEVRDIASTFATVDQRINFNGVAAPTVFTASSDNVITGQVTDATGVGVAGAKVTISAPGAQFVAGSVYATDSITVSADATGSYTVTAYSHKSGKVTYTATSGAVTKTADVTYAAAVQANHSATTVTVPATSQTGRAVAVVATVVDKFGNPVFGMAVAFTATGVGSLSAATATTDVNGVAQVKLVTQQGEDGDAVITVSHLGADNANTSDAEKVDDFTSAKTVTFGVTDAQIDITGKRVTSVTSFSKGKTVSFYVDGIKKWSKLSASDADVLVYYNLKKGTHTITIKVSGGFVTTERFIVK